MKTCTVISIFPELFVPFCQVGIVGRAVKNRLMDFACINPRDFCEDVHQSVDDRPFGGGPGMVMKAPPLAKAIEAACARTTHKSKVIYLSPSGTVLNHQSLKPLFKENDLVFLAGRYEGVDQRVIDQHVDEQISIGDYVLSGGEIPAMVVIEAWVRWLPGALGDAASAQQDAFANAHMPLLDCPHYTRPRDYNGQQVPQVLLEGDHEAIANWRAKQALGHTWLHRKELLDERSLDAHSLKLLKEFMAEHK